MPSKSPSRHSTYNSRGQRKIASRGKKCAASEDGCYDVQDVEKMPAMSSDLKQGISEVAREMEKFDKDYANVCYIFRDEALHKNIELVGPSRDYPNERLKAKDEYENRTNIKNYWTDVYENSKEETMPQFCYLKEGNNIKKAKLMSYAGQQFVSGVVGIDADANFGGGKKRKTKKQKKSKKQRKTKKQKKSKKARK